MRRLQLALLVVAAAVACREQDDAAKAPAAPAAPAAANAPAAASPGGGDFFVPPPLLPRGLITREPGVADGYVLFNQSLSDTAYLVDNEGRVVHVWKTPYGPGGDSELLPNGNLLRGARDPEALSFKVGGVGGILQEIDWDGRVVWEWKLSDAQRIHHHDVTVLPNGHVLLLGWEVKSPAEARAAGRRGDWLPERGLFVDYVLEIEPVRPRGARIVWEWHLWDHLVQDLDPEAPSFAEPATRPERIDLNADAGGAPVDAAQLEQLKALGYVQADAKPADLRSDFLHVNTVAYHPRLDQIALSSPVLGEIWIIDHSTSSAEAAGSRGGKAGRGGDLLYRWGNPSAYGRGDGAKHAKRLFYQHDVRWIPDGWPGAGNLLVFNNGRDRPEGAWSSVDEWTPPLEPSGRYALEETGAFGPSALTWQYKAEEPTELYSPFISGAQRLANGNTLICEGGGGRFIEVTRDGRVVWEYRNPFSGDVRNADGSLPQPQASERPFAVYRATRIPADHPALAGRELAPLDPQPPWHEWKPPPESAESRSRRASAGLDIDHVEPSARRRLVAKHRLAREIGGGQEADAAHREAARVCEDDGDEVERVDAVVGPRREADARARRDREHEPPPDRCGRG
ncbi:MAG TPA: aryl-sulfate sulfotransferase [Myxococcota bacterium]|nr:aryl-sulfate sulfotransferase [Myxococcota bacterium]